MRFLYPGISHDGARFSQGEPAADAGRSPRGDFRQYLPLHGISAHRRRNSPGSTGFTRLQRAREIKWKLKTGPRRVMSAGRLSGAKIFASLPDEQLTSTISSCPKCFMEPSCAAHELMRGFVPSMQPRRLSSREL